MTGRGRRFLRCGDRELVLGERTFVMGIVNVTPDSFSDGGALHRPDGGVDVERAVAHALQLLDDGADVLDIGGESTRPGAPTSGVGAVDVDEELRRVLPLIEALARRGVKNLSVDTRHAAVADRALAAGAAWINDVDALADPGMAAVAARADAVVLMHWHKVAKDARDAREDHAVYGDVVDDVHRVLASRVVVAALPPLLEPGGERVRVVVDPGIGFGKTVDDNVRLLGSGTRFHDLGAVLVGASRKRFLGAVLGRSGRVRDVPADRDGASVGAACAAAFGGAHLVRVHAVQQTVDALRIVDATVRC